MITKIFGSISQSINAKINKLFKSKYLLKFIQKNSLLSLLSLLLWIRKIDFWIQIKMCLNLDIYEIKLFSQKVILMIYLSFIAFICVIKFLTVVFLFVLNNCLFPNWNGRFKLSLLLAKNADDNCPVNVLKDVTAFMLNLLEHF